MLEMNQIDLQDPLEDLLEDPHEGPHEDPHEDLHGGILRTQVEVMVAEVSNLMLHFQSMEQ